MTDEPAAPAPDAAVSSPPSPADGSAAAQHAAAAPDVPGLDELIGWLTERTPSVARAKIAAHVVKRINDDVIDPALVYAWQHRHAQAEMRDLAAAAGVNIARVAWALRRHPRSDT